MCMICVKPAGAKWNMDGLRRAVEVNPNGLGVAWRTNDGTLAVRHSLCPSDLEKLLQQVPRRAPALFHCRYTTHGLTILENTHPFRVAGRPNLAFAHNGMITQFPVDEVKSDTRIFNESILSQCRARFEEQQDALERMAQLTRSKFAFLRADGRWFLAGAFHQYRGCWYSNSGYRPPVTLPLFTLPDWPSTDKAATWPMAKSRFSWLPQPQEKS